MTGHRQFPGAGCVTFTRAADAQNPVEALLSILREASDSLRLESLEVSDIGPGKGCAVSVSIENDRSCVTVVAGVDGDRLWIASWEDPLRADVGTPPIEGIIHQVGSAIARVLDAQPNVSDVQWMTLKEWAAVGKKRESLRAAAVEQRGATDGRC